jgi:aminoglycoside phosphotransferase (APT) family kinase protein
VTSRLDRYLEVLGSDGHPPPGGAVTFRSGQFHDVVLTGEVAYRFPRDAETRRRLPGRVALLCALTRCELPVAIPEPVDTSHLDRPVGSCYVAVRRLTGEPAEPGPVTGEAAVHALATRLARLLDALAALGGTEDVRRAVPSAAANQWLDWSEQVRRVLFPLMSAPGRRRAEAELAAVATVPATGDELVHGDLGGANLLLNPAVDVPVLTGVLDWDEASVGNQANDLASLAVTFGWPVAERIDAAWQARAGQHGRVAGRRGGAAGPLIGAARSIAATFALQQALPAALSGDQENLDDGLSTYR